MKNFIWVLLAATVAIQQTTAQCSKGDLPCFCRSFGGFWVNQPSGLLSACQLDYQWQGAYQFFILTVILGPAMVLVAPKALACANCRSRLCSGVSLVKNASVEPAIAPLFATHT
jgi:hypothetical protein